MQDHLIQQLQTLGLNEKESSLYLALLENGEMTVSELSSITKLQRTSLYDLLPPLVQSGFVSKVPGNKKQRYQAAPAENLPLLLEARAKKMEHLAEKAKDLVPELQRASIQSSSKPSITIYEGDQGLKKLYDTTLKCKTFIRSFLTADTLEAFDAEYANNYFKRRTKKGINIRGILNNSDLSRGYKKKSKEFLREINLVPHEKMNIVPEVYLYDDTIAIFSLKEKLGISIESKDITQAFKKLYDLAWERSEQYNKELR
jgi:sugar-specific transcriptional regulator TrmB